MSLHFRCSGCGYEWKPELGPKNGIYDIGGRLQCPKCHIEKDLINCGIVVK